MVNTRLDAIISLIDNANTVVDVGSDHAYLSVNLIKQKKAKRVYNIEKNQKPFLLSCQNTKHFQNQIFNIYSDGFKNFDKNIEIDYCVIAGMGANNIIDILKNCYNKINNLILCGNNNESLIREFAYHNNYKFIKDFSVIENDIVYQIIWLNKNNGLKIKNKQKIFLLGVNKLKKLNDLYDLYLLNKIKPLLKISNLKQVNYAKYLELKIYQKELKKWKLKSALKF